MSKSFRQWLLDHGGIRQRGEGTESIHQLPVTTVLQKYDECAKQESEKRMDTIEIKLTRRNGDVTATKEFSVDAASVRDDFITGQAYSLFRTKLCELAVIQMQPFATRSLPRDLSKDPDEVIAETQDSVILDSSNPC